VPSCISDGIETHYEVYGSGEPLLLHAPGGFDATVEKWRTLGIYAGLKLLEHLPRRFKCIAFDRRESGTSGGRIEPIGWAEYARQSLGLLRRLDIERAHHLGGCMGCSVALSFGVAYPEATLSLVLFWPVGGAMYRINGHRRFSEHLAYVRDHGLAAVVELARNSESMFAADPRVSPWVSLIRRDPEFADTFARFPMERYAEIIDVMKHGLFDRDTSPGAEPEDLMKLDVPALIIPGNDQSHATSAARYLGECLPRAEYVDLAVAGQTEPTIPSRMISFLDAQGVATWQKQPS
jgi:pimeloyl-ACP methyl ester carboxylesterase